MFKTVVTLFRGSVAAAGEELEDRSALLILDQQMRDAAAAVERSKRTLALAIAGDQQEGRRLDATNARIADLEVRATAALDGGREDLAREAAQAIAGLEADRDAAMTARALFASEIARLKRQVSGAEARITELDRGRRARAAERQTHASCLKLNRFTHTKLQENYHEPECPTPQQRLGYLHLRFVFRFGLHGRRRRVLSAARSLDQGLFRHGHRDA